MKSQSASEIATTIAAKSVEKSVEIATEIAVIRIAGISDRCDFKSTSGLDLKSPTVPESHKDRVTTLGHPQTPTERRRDPAEPSKRPPQRPLRTL